MTRTRHTYITQHNLITNTMQFKHNTDNNWKEKHIVMEALLHLLLSRDSLKSCTCSCPFLHWCIEGISSRSKNMTKESPKLVENFWWICDCHFATQRWWLVRLLTSSFYHFCVVLVLFLNISHGTSEKFARNMIEVFDASLRTNILIVANEMKYLHENVAILIN
jgi:hypothetical protein